MEVQLAAWMPGPIPRILVPLISFTLDCRGVVYASGSGFAITVQATGAVVTFRNVIFDGAAGGGGAVQITGGKVVFENCTFQNFTASPGEAVQFAPTVAGAHLTITDSVFANNGNAAGGGGIVIQPSAGVTAGAVIERTQVAGNTYGIVANGSGGTALVEVRYSTIADNTLDGIWAYTDRFDCIHHRRAQRIGPKRRQWHQCDRCRCLCVAQRLDSGLECDGPGHVERRPHSFISRTM